MIHLLPATLLIYSTKIQKRKDYYSKTYLFCISENCLEPSHKFSEVKLFSLRRIEHYVLSFFYTSPYTRKAIIVSFTEFFDQLREPRRFFHMLKKIIHAYRQPFMSELRFNNTK